MEQSSLFPTTKRILNKMLHPMNTGESAPQAGDYSKFRKKIETPLSLFKGFGKLSRTLLQIVVGFQSLLQPVSDRLHLLTSSRASRALPI